MTNKRCLVYETLGKVSDLQVIESANSNEVRLHGVFGVCGVKNNNNRVYDKDNYRQMVESLQNIIKESGCPGELEHPNTMNINLENVSHKIEDIQMNEDGTITGTILLLNTPKGQIAKAIVEGGLPLYISSRGAGTITNESGVAHVTLSTIKTYDLVGTPGFSQAKLTLKENQTLECLNESAEDGNVMYAIVEGDDLMNDDSADDKDNKNDKDTKDDDKDTKSDDKKDDKKEDDKKEDDDKKDDKDDNKNNDNDINMKELKEAIDKLTEKVTSLEAELHVAQESLNENKPVDYDAIQQWVTEEFAAAFKKEIAESLNNDEDIMNAIDTKVDAAIATIAEGVENWVTEEFAPEVHDWVNEEFAPKVQDWVTEEFATEVQNWITEEYSGELQKWISEEYSGELQTWITEEYSGELQTWISEEFSNTLNEWITEEFAPAQSEAIEAKVNENVSAFMESQKAGRLEEIDSLLESLSDDSNATLDQIVNEHKAEEKYAGIYVVENMPSEYVPQWQLLDEARKDEVVRSSRMYDFTKEGVLESFWTNVEFSKKAEKQIAESQEVDTVASYKSRVAAAMRYLQK